MKKILFIFLFILIAMTLCINPVYARAGGGSSGGSSGGISSSSGSHHTSSSHNSNPIVSIINYILFTIICFSSVIVIKYRLTKARVKTKIDFKKTSWSYDEVGKRIEDAYFIIQEAWASNDMSKAKDYMTPELLENFTLKLNWMEVADKKNILKNIKLLDCYPISFTDLEGDKDDCLWVYIKGKMIDYVLNIKTNEIIEGSTMSKSFVEYWLFSKNKKGNWVLKKILQEDELESIPLDV